MKNNDKMKKNEIKKMRMNLGKFLHEYYIRFGEEKYEEFMEQLGPALEQEYGEPFSGENMRIMEAEFVTLSATIRDRHGKNKDNSKC